MRTSRRKHIPKPMKIRAECSEVSIKGWRRCAKEDAERMTLALTILTAGVAGPIASVLVKDKAAKVFEKLAENMQGKASKTALEAAGEMVKDSAGDLTKKGLEKVAQEVSKAYERPSVEDAFHSSGVPPDQYGDQLQEAIDLQTGVLQKLITAFMRKGSAGMTMDDAKQLLSRILNTDFVKYPPSAVKKGVPEKEGERGVVAGVGLGPRPEYWERHSLLFNAKELSASSRFDGSWLTNCNFRPARSTRQG